MKAIRRTLLWALPVLIAGILTYFLLDELAFQRQERAFQAVRQRIQEGWTLSLDYREDRWSSDCGGGKFIIDNEQRLWLASQCKAEGIHVFDGTKWTTYTPLQSRTFTTLAVDTLGQIWANDGKTVAYFDGEKWVTSLRLDDSSVGRIESLIADNRGAIWIYIYNGSDSGIIERSQVRIYQDGKWTTYTPGHSGLPSEIDPDGNFAGWNGIALDAHGTARIMTDDGAFVLVGNSWQAPADESDEPGQPVLGILDGRGRSWVWNDSEVSVLEKTGWITLTPENSGLAAEGIYALKVDASGRVWIANNEGVNVFDGGEIQTIPADLIDQRQKILESRESRRGYNWFLPSVLALLWAAAYLNMNLLSPAVVLFVLGVPLTWLFGPAIGESFGYSRYINPGVVFTYGGLLGGIMGTMIDNALGTPGRFAWAKLLPIIFAVPAGAIAFLWLVVVSTP